MKSSIKRSKSFWVSNMEISRTSQKLHFRVTKKDPCLPLHFHILILFKSLSDLGFDQDTNGWAQNSKKKQNNEKQKHVVFLCHIVCIQVKQGLGISKPEKSCIYPLLIL